MKPLLCPVLLFLVLACSAPDSEATDDDRYQLNWEGEDDLLAEVCPRYAPDGYDFISMKRAKSALQNRHNGERMTANLAPNKLHCSFLSKQDSKDCYRFFDVNISPGGAIQFCIRDVDGEVVDFVIEE
jgi:hypothetical protein